MFKRRASALLLVAAALLLVPATGAQAQTTGRILGQVLDAQGAALPGATVTVSSPNLQGVQTQVTDSEGNYRFLSLPPGRYTVKVELASFKTAEQPNVDVGLDKTVTLPVTLQLASVTESVTVTAVSSTIDTTSTVTGVNAGADLFERIPLRRDFYAVARVAPGTTEDTVGTVVYGSTGAENQYIIDGLNTTGVEVGDKGKTLNFDFVQEVEVKTGGLPAEYGRMTGGVLNVVTKSGSNTLRGSGFVNTEGGFLQADDDTRDKRPAWTTTVTDIDSRSDFGGELGGPFFRDRLWFFGAYNRTNENRNTTVIRALASPGSPAINSEVPTSIDRDLFAAKLTYRIAEGQTLNGTVMGDPSTRDGAIFTIAGPETTWKGVREFGGTDFVGKYAGVFGSRFLLNGLIARHNESDTWSGAGRDIAQLIDQTVTPTATSGGFGFFQDQDFKRDVYKVDASSYLGAHDVKVGFDTEHVKAVNNNYNGGAGQRIYKLVTGGVTYYRHRYYINDRAPGYDRSNGATWQIALPLTSEPDSLNTSFYAQDSWKAGAGLTVNAGIRWEGQNVRDRDNVSAFKLTDNWAPRIGFVWDVARNNRSKLYANWGRFYESIPMDINIRSFGGEVSCFCYNFSPSAANILQDPAAPRPQALNGGSVTPVDPDLKGQYIEEWLAGFEYDLGRNFVVGAKYGHRELGRVIEDFLIPEAGEYFIANPGTGVGTEMGFYDGHSTAAAPKAKRTNNAFEVNARKRFSNNWQFLASAVFSKLEGNYDGTYQVSTGQLDPNINSAFDYADFLVNADGKLSNDRLFSLKLDGSYEFSKGGLTGLNLGLSTHLYSGLPLNAYGYSFAYQNWEYYLVPRGSAGRGPKDWETDLQARYPIRISGPRRLVLQADIFNVFNRQAITALDERYNLAEHGGCAGIPEANCNGDNGITTTGNNLIPSFKINDPRATAPNPDYLKKGVLFTQPFSLRVGVRFEF
ncbi:MAG TPA: carboxypeptidase regulatory-like domain-containing protein [Vicinamibacterales bacterium]|jgi:carboxypeptidase family protein|nr:carboxypeptidase regulatory-like domain-containing protein [Vicinamibacterales bacterium]